MIIKNAIIESIKLTTEDYGLLSAWIFLNYSGSGQGFGGYSLYLPKDFKHHDKGANYAGHFIWRVMEIADVTEWNQMVGKTIRVKKTDDFGDIVAIGHIIKDDWFNPDEEFKHMRALYDLDKVGMSDKYETAFVNICSRASRGTAFISEAAELGKHADCEITQLKSLLRQAVDRIPEWKSMESAPKDGTKILLYSEGIENTGPMYNTACYMCSTHSHLSIKHNCPNEPDCKMAWYVGLGTLGVQPIKWCEIPTHDPEFINELF